MHSRQKKLKVNLEILATTLLPLDTNYIPLFTDGLQSGIELALLTPQLVEERTKKYHRKVKGIREGKQTSMFSQEIGQKSKKEPQSRDGPKHQAVFGNSQEKTEKQMAKHQKREFKMKKYNRVLEIIRSHKCKNMFYFKKKYPRESWLQKLIFCTCKGSHCHKKYCQCYQNGVSCGQFCRCLECMNEESVDSKERENSQGSNQWWAVIDHLPKKAQMEDFKDEVKKDNMNRDVEESFQEEMEFEPPLFIDLPIL